MTQEHERQRAISKFKWKSVILTLKRKVAKLHCGLTLLVGVVTNSIVWDLCTWNTEHHSPYILSKDEKYICHPVFFHFENFTKYFWCHQSSYHFIFDFLQTFYDLQNVWWRVQVYLAFSSFSRTKLSFNCSWRVGITKNKEKVVT